MATIRGRQARRCAAVCWPGCRAVASDSARSSRSWRAAAQLGAEVQRRAMALATILEPLLIVVMGVVVMLIVLAVLLPIIQLNTWVK